MLREVDRLDRSVQEEQERCAELRVMIPHATYASYAAVDDRSKMRRWYSSSRFFSALLTLG